jgi:hypothetical protein
MPQSAILQDDMTSLQRRTLTQGDRAFDGRLDTYNGAHLPLILFKCLSRNGLVGLGASGETSLEPVPRVLGISSAFVTTLFNRAWSS